MIFKLDRRFTHQAKGILEKYDFQVGIFESTAHKEAEPRSTGTYAGGPVRKASRTNSGKTVSQVSEELRARTGINIFTQPFIAKKNKEIVTFVKEYFDLCAGRTQKRRVENLMQAIVRNPILRGDYGKNSPLTAKIKGFNRFMIDTAQLFRAITAKIKVNRVQS